MYACGGRNERTNERRKDASFATSEQRPRTRVGPLSRHAVSYLLSIQHSARKGRASTNRTEPNRTGCLGGPPLPVPLHAQRGREEAEKGSRPGRKGLRDMQRSGRGVTADCRLLARCVPVRDWPPPTTATSHVSSTDGRTGEAADRWRMPPPHGGRWSRCPRTSARARLLPPPPEGQAPAGDVSCAPSTATQVCMCEWMCGGGRCESAAATGKHAAAAAAASPDEHTTAHHRTPPHSTAALGRSTLHTPMQIRPWLSDRGGHGS